MAHRSKIAFMKWHEIFNLMKVSYASSRIISQLVNLIDIPFKLKVLIWDICMSENRCLLYWNKAFSFLFERAIREAKITWKFITSWNFMKKFPHLKTITWKQKSQHENYMKRQNVEKIHSCNYMKSKLHLQK